MYVYIYRTHRYNYDPVYTSGEESLDDFVVYGEGEGSLSGGSSASYNSTSTSEESVKKVKLCFCSMHMLSYLYTEMTVELLNVSPIDGST